jgi:hypothetical protein
MPRHTAEYALTSLCFTAPSTSIVRALRGVRLVGMDVVALEGQAR